MNKQELEALESLSEKFYSSVSQAERDEATRALSSFFDPANPNQVMGQAQYILDNSNSPFALHLAANSLSNIIVTNWNNFATPQTVEIKNYLLTYLGNRPKLASFVLKELIKLVCTIVKLGWFDSQEHQEIVQQITKFLQASLPHCVIGFLLLNDLVEVMDIPNRGSLALAKHRKIAINFRDTSLLQIFQISLSTLQQISSKSNTFEDESSPEHSLIQSTLDLALKCLSFDFIGTSPDPSSGDLSTVQIPSSWRSIFKEQQTLGVFFSAYKLAKPPVSELALKCLVQIASVRKSLFVEEEERTEFLNNLMNGINVIIKEQIGLNYPENHHEICRLLARLKGNFQLSQIVVTNSYPDWIALLADFTIRSMKAWKWAPNSVHYLLTLWSRMVASMGYLKEQTPSLIENYIPQVIEVYITSRLEVAADYGGDEDPLEDEEVVTDHLEALPYMGRCDYRHTYLFIINHFDPLANSYQNVVDSPQKEIVEGQLAWLVYIIGAVVGGRLGVNSTEFDQLDGELAARVFQLQRIHETRIVRIGADASSRRVEMSILYFLQQFRRMYAGGGEQTAEASELYKVLSMHLGLTSNIMVMNVVLMKLVFNLKYWAQDSKVVSRSVRFLYDLVLGYGSHKLLTKMDVVKEILTHHTSQYFPFMNYIKNSRERSTFYETLAKLLFVEPYITSFDQFMDPFKAEFQKMLSCPSLDMFVQNECKSIFIGVVRDLTGIVTSCTSRESYRLIFDWLYPSKFPVLLQGATAFYNQPEAIIPLLKFISEFVLSKAGRISFESSSPNGILLFRETSKILVAYGHQLLQMNVSDPKDMYTLKYKGIRLCMQILTRSLVGGYVNFGVFLLYGDLALSNALSVVLKLALSIPWDDMMGYPKVLADYFSLMNVLCSNHATSIIDLDSFVFIKILASLKEGLDILTGNVRPQSYEGIDKIASCVNDNKNKDNNVVANFRKHMENSPNVFMEILEILFKQLLFEKNPNHWGLAKPILSVIMLHPDNFNRLKSKLISAQALPDRRDRLQEAFDKLMEDVSENLLPKNRDKFAQNLNAFVNNVRSFLS